MLLIYFTSFVLKLERLSDERAEQLLNISTILSTFSVLNLERSSEESFLQSKNIPDIYFTFAVFKYSRSEIVSNVLQLEKNCSNDVGAYVLKLSSKTIFLIFVVSISYISFTIGLSFTITKRLKSILSKLEVIFLKVNVLLDDSYSAT